MRSNQHHHYHGFGLTCSSDLPLPELSPTTSAADFVIQQGVVPTSLVTPGRSKPVHANPETSTLETSTSPQFAEPLLSTNQTGHIQRALYEIRGRQFLLNLSELAGVRYLVEDGQRITIECLPSAQESQVRLFLLSTCLGALLYQRNLFPLHGSAIQTKQGSVIFTGDSGSGKSTLAAAFQQQGYPILTDDICVIQRNQANQLLLMPGIPWLKLWTDAAEQVQQTHALGRAVQPDMNKYWLPLGEHFAVAPAPPHMIFLLQPDNRDDIDIEAVQGVDKVAPLQLNAYRHQLALEMGKEPLLFQQASRLANQVSLYRIRRPRHHFCLTDLVDRIGELL